MRFLSLLLVSTLCCSPVFTKEARPKKHYLTQEQVQITEGKLLVQLSNGWVPVKRLHCDIKGIFIHKTDIAKLAAKYSDIEGPYQCQYCGTGFCQTKARDFHERSCWRRR